MSDTGAGTPRATRCGVVEVGLDGRMGTAPVEVERPASADPETEDVVLTDSPWVTIVWNDPVNLMSYVSYVFQSYFGYPKDKSERLMRTVHFEGRAVVSAGSREKMERDVQAMHEYGLWATCQRSDA